MRYLLAGFDEDGHLPLFLMCSDLEEPIVGVRPVAMSSSADSVPLDSQTAGTPGLIVNELVTDAIK